MMLRVGPFLYRVRFVDGYIEHEGEKCLGLCDNDAHELLVSTVTSEAQQIQVICHEYMEAWLFHFGTNMHDKEDYCDLFGMAMTQFVLDLTRQLQALADELEQHPSADDQATSATSPASAKGGTPADTSAASAPAAEQPVDATAMLRCLGQAARAEPGPSAAPARDADAAPADTGITPPPPGQVARKLAGQAARAGLRVRDVYEGR